MQPSSSPSLPPAQEAASTPTAMDSAALHAARLHFGKNAIELLPIPLQGFLRFPVVSPTMLVVVAGLLVNITVYMDYISLVVLLLVLVVQSILLIHTARTSRSRVVALLRCFQHSSVVAYREGTWVLVDSAQLLPGDLIQLVQGCIVHADCTLYRGTLFLDLSSLTGRTDVTRAEPGHLLKAGTVIVDGSGSATVCYTGTETFIGQTVRLLQHLALGLRRPLVQRAYVSVCFAILVVMVTAEIVLYGVLRGWYHLPARVIAGEMMLYALACLPLNLDLAVLQAVSGGAAQAMHRTQAIVLRLGAMLSLASMNVLVVDKSGTLTTGVYGITNEWHSFSSQYPSRNSLVQLMALATKWREPCLHAMQRAVLRCADLDVCDQYTRLAYVEHEGEHRTSTILRQRDGTLLRVTEGRVEAVLALLLRDKNPTDETIRSCADTRRLCATWAARGLRTRAVAVGTESGPLALAGLVAFEDALREDSAQFVRDCEACGVAVTIASGDVKAVVTTVATALFPAALAASSASVMTGSDMPTLDVWQALNASSLAASTPSAAFSLLPTAATNAGDAAAYAACHVFAEMQSEHKVALLRLLQQAGLCVGMMGDGVNDAAAMHVADVGIAHVNPDKMQPFSGEGVLWGADVVLPSTRLTGTCELIAASRALFATVHSLFFYAFTSSMQTAVLVLLAAFASPLNAVPHSGGGYGTYLPSLAPSELFLPLYVCITLLCLLFQARHQGDVAYWSTAPCRLSGRVGATQAACMALVGVAAGVPLLMGVSPYSLLYKGEMPHRSHTLQAVSVMLYLVYLQLCLSLSCASPVRCGLRFLRCRMVYVVSVVVIVGLVLFITCGVCVVAQLTLLVYCVVVGALQDAVKLAVHCVCYRFDCFAYRGCVAHMSGQRRRRSGREVDLTRESDNGGAVEAAEEESEEANEAASEESAVATQRPMRPFSSALNAVLGCLVPLELRLITAARSEPFIAADEE